MKWVVNLPKVNKIGVYSQTEEKIVKLFKHALINKGWTMKHLAALCKMDPPQLSRNINHPLSVRFETILMIAKKLGIENIPV